MKRISIWKSDIGSRLEQRARRDFVTTVEQETIS